ncbi:hypothetical protein PV08_00925 [Exophiala spinifera]|uniref:Uncharacterized protein n=1 Tax=Exophiala spinifera TaxID=91928 RepID=A0A0D2BPA3_9EURO|nr:uncharacterized protein PV08_00925 [Exophiala spinifera]KIW20350.1 hypothetical protein PV08_00925 [Exophiala spinifera]
MLRYLFRRSRSIRVPLKNGIFDLQRVSVKKKSKPIVSRVLTTFLISYCVLNTIRYVIPQKDSQGKAGPVSERTAVPGGWLESVRGQGKIQDHSKATTGDSKLYQQEAFRMWLPWMRARAPPMYTADDPDWKEYQKLQQDEKLITSIKLQVVQMALETALPRYRMNMAAVGANPYVVRMDLDVVPPIYPPEIYEVSCLCFESNRVTMDWQRLSPGVGSKVYHVFHPIQAGNAFYYGLRQFVTVSYAITRARLIDFYNSIQKSANSGENDGGEHNEATGTLSESDKLESKLWINGLSDKDKAPFLPYLRGEYSEQLSVRAYRDMVKSITYQQAIESGVVVFRAKMNALRALSGQLHVRDGVTVEGSLVWVGTRGRFRLNVRAIYSPERGSIVGNVFLERAYIVPDTSKWHSKKRGQQDGVIVQPAVEADSTQTPVKPSKEQESPQSESSTEEKDK